MDLSDDKFVVDRNKAVASMRKAVGEITIIAVYYAILLPIALLVDNWRCKMSPFSAIKKRLFFSFFR